MMAQILSADIMTGFRSSASFDPIAEGFQGKFITLMSPILIKRFRHVLLKFVFFTRSKALKNYDVVIFSGDCLGAVRSVSKSAKKIYYCHTPPRYMFDRSKDYEKSAGMIRWVQNHVIEVFRRWYLSDLAQMDSVVSNSLNIQRRLKEFTGVDSTVVYPPVAELFFAPQKRDASLQKDYYFCWARLSRLKRVDRIIEAFQKLPDKKFVFTYRTNDPEKDRIFALIEGFHNIVAIESPTDESLLSLIAGAIATIYIPIDEDFGMTPVESMAQGVPVIGVRDGGLLETILHEKTGLMISPSANVDELIEAIERMTDSYACALESACREQARRFDTARFAEGMRRMVEGSNEV